MYVIYENTSTLIIGKDGRPDHRAVYKTMGAAKAAITRMRKAWFKTQDQCPDNDPLFRYAIAESAYFSKNIEKQRRVKNMMTGAEFSEPVNTPAYMSPSRESYWSM
jgi:hypothetical protein